MASTIDIGPTILERAGLSPYRGIQGRSFLGSLDGVTAHRDEVFIENNDGGARLGFGKPNRNRTLRSKTHRITLYSDQEWGELYDLSADPNETLNLWDDPNSAGVKADLILKLAHYLTAQMDESPKSIRQA